MSKTAPPLSSKMIIGAKCSPETEAKIRALDPSVAPDAELNFMVFEVEIDGQVRYCCASGGSVEHGPMLRPREPKFTLIGMAALEALTSLPFAKGRGVGLCEVRIGPTPLQKKVVDLFRRSADTGELLCFFGDLAGELDGKLSMALNFNGMVNIEDCVGLPQPGQSSASKNRSRPN